LASWPELKQYIQDTYVVTRDVGEGLELEFHGEGRSQKMFVTHIQLNDGNDGDWVSIESPIGKSAEVDIVQALAAAGDVVCGGLALWAIDPTFLVMKHGIPLENVDLNEFQLPVQLLAGTADRMEKELTGEDRL